MKINYVQFEFDGTSKKNMEDMEAAIHNMSKQHEELKANPPAKYSKTLETSIKIIADFFKESTGTDVLQGVESYKVAIECYEQFLGEIDGQKPTFTNKYSPKRLR